MIRTEDLSVVVAELEAKLREDEEKRRALQEAVEGCDPRARFPMPEELPELLPARQAHLAHARPALWGALRA